MKIIYLHQYFNTPDMAGGSRSYQFAKRLVQMGHEVHVVTTFRKMDKRKNWFKTNESGINVHWLPLVYSNHYGYLKRIKSFIIFACKAAFKSASLTADIVFATSTPLSIALPAIYVSKKKKIPMVFEVRDLWPSVPIALKVLNNPIICYLARLLEKWVYKKASSIIALSPTMKSVIVSNNKISSNKIAVIPNSCDIQDFLFNKELEKNFRKVRPWIGDNPLLVYSGTFGLVNNLQYAVKLAKALHEQNSNIKILLIGDGKEKKTLIDEAKKNKVFEINLFFENPIPKKEMRSCLSAATICANFVIDVKETWANSANKFFDTLAAGKPIFLNHGGWMQDIIVSYKSGLCMHGKPIHEVASELDIVMSDKKWLQESGENALKLAKKFFDRDIHVKQLEKILINAKEGKPEFTEKIASGIYI